MNENVNVCITPKGEKPVLHFSQFDNERVFTVTVLADDGESAAVLTGLDIEFRLRKTDSHVVTIAPESVADNVITFKTTEQLCACCGQNIASVVLMDSEMIVSTLDILVDIQRDILSGGLTSESDIRNLTTQIESIIPEVLADDYYTKTEVDEIIADIPTFDPTNYYDKSDVDTLLSAKADASDVYTKGETDTLLFDKADKSDVYTKAQTDSLLFFKADKINEKTASGLPAAIASFTDAGKDCPLSSLTVAVTAEQSGSGVPAPDNVRPITGHSSCTITVADSDETPVNTVTVSFEQTVYGGVLDVTNGKLKITHAGQTFTSVVNGGASSTASWWGQLLSSGAKPTNNNIKADVKANYLETVKASQVINTENNCIGVNTNGAINIKIQGMSSLADYNTYLANNPLTVVYELATPTEITLTPAEVDTVLGDNNVYADTGDILTLKYFGFNAEDLFRYIRLIKG